MAMFQSLLNACHILSHLIFTITLDGSFYFCFTDKKLVLREVSRAV